MKRTFGWFVFLAFMVAFAGFSRASGSGDIPAAAGSEPAPTLAADRPSVELPETSHDFGEVVEGKQYVHDFKVWNIGTAPLHIKKVLPG